MRKLWKTVALAATMALLAGTGAQASTVKEIMLTPLPKEMPDDDKGFSVALQKLLDLWSEYLKVLDEVAGRIEKCLSDRVQWMSAEEIMRLVLEDPARYPMPEFKK